MASGARALQSAFHRYERDRLAFATAVADAARTEGNAVPLVALGAPRLLLPLLTDSVDAVAYTAAAALGRLAGNSAVMAEEQAASGVVNMLLGRAEEQAAAGDESGNAMRAAMTMLAALTRHAAGVVGVTVEKGGLAAAISCLQGKDGESREAAVWTLAHLASHSRALAETVVAAGALPPLLACLSGPPTAIDAVVRRVAASALADITGHSAQLAADVVGEGGVAVIAAQLRQSLSNDARLKRQLLCALVNICSCDAGLAAEVVGAGLVLDIGRCLKFADDTVRRQAAACLRDIARHSADLATAVADEPGVLEALAHYAAAASSTPMLPALMAVGFLAGHSAELAASVTATPGAVPAVVMALQSSDEPCQAAAAWALGRIGSWEPALAAEAAAGLLRLCVLASSAAEGSDLQSKCLKAASGLVAHLSDMNQLASLLMQPWLASSLLELLLARCAAIMAKQPATRADFATSGALAWLEARAESNSATSQYIAACLRLFPEELLQHYSAAHASKLLAALSIDPPPADAIAAVPASQTAEMQEGAEESSMVAPAPAVEPQAAEMSATAEVEADEQPAEEESSQQDIAIPATVVESPKQQQMEQAVELLAAKEELLADAVPATLPSAEVAEAAVAAVDGPVADAARQPNSMSPEPPPQVPADTEAAGMPAVDLPAVEQPAVEGAAATEDGTVMVLDAIASPQDTSEGQDGQQAEAAASQLRLAGTAAKHLTPSMEQATAEDNATASTVAAAAAAEAKAPPAKGHMDAAETVAGAQASTDGSS